MFPWLGRDCGFEYPRVVQTQDLRVPPGPFFKMYPQGFKEKLGFGIGVTGNMLWDVISGAAGLVRERVDLVGKLQARNTYRSIENVHAQICEFYNSLYDLDMEPAAMKFSPRDTSRYDYVKDEITFAKNFTYQDVLGLEAAVMNLAEIEGMRYFRNARRDLDSNEQDHYEEFRLKLGTGEYATMIVMGWLGFEVIPQAMQEEGEFRARHYWDDVSGVAGSNFGKMDDFSEMIRLPVSEALERLNPRWAFGSMRAIGLRAYVYDYLRNNPDALKERSYAELPTPKVAGLLE